MKIEALTKLGSTPPIKKISGLTYAVALCPAAPLVAEFGYLDDESGAGILRVSNYQSASLGGQAPFPAGPHTLSFSPSGRRLLAMPGAKGAWRAVFIYADPWEPSPIFSNETALGATFHGTWLDEQTVLIAGRLAYEELCIAILDVERKSLRVVYQEVQKKSSAYGAENIDSGYCSPSGLVSFALGYGRRIALYQLQGDRETVIAENSFEARYDGYGTALAIAENGQTIACFSGNYNSPWCGLFDRQGRLLAKLRPGRREGTYKLGCFCLWSRSEAEFHYVRNGVVKRWCSAYLSSATGGCDLTLKNEKMLVAIETENQTTVFEITDPDVLQLASEDATERFQAARSLGERRFGPAVSFLIRTLLDDDANVQTAAIESLAKIGDRAALPQLLRLFGRDCDKTPSMGLMQALKSFPIAQLVHAVFDAVARPGVAFRLGATRVLEILPAIEATEVLCEGINDVDTEVRCSVANALRKRADLRTCVALLGHINDSDETVRSAVRRALVATLQVNGFLPHIGNEQFLPSMDIAAYAGDVISTGRMRDFQTSTAGNFLTALGAACVQSGRPLPQILNAIDALTATSEQFPTEDSASIALTISLICGDAMRLGRKWQEAAAIYQRAVALAKQAGAPQMEWRAWSAGGECFEAMGEDAAALLAFRHAMEIIDRLWFLLLEEDKLREFFQDKALLYDRAGLCCLRLGYKESALECCEKGKTRYLGDLIARRQRNPRISLDRETTEFWQSVGKLHTVRASVGSYKGASKELVEIVAARWDTTEETRRIVTPQHLAAFEEACQYDERLRERLPLIHDAWRLMIAISSSEDEILRQHIEEIYQALLPIYESVKANSLPVAEADQRSSFQVFDDAAERLSRVGGDNQDVKFWLFSENRLSLHTWIEEICNGSEASDTAKFLESLVEALNVLLHHEPVHAINDEGRTEEGEGPVFATRSLGREPNSSRQGTVPVESALERRSQSRWRYVAKLARGEISTYRDMALSLQDQSRVAQVQFSITEYGTVAYILFGHASPAITKQPLLPPIQAGEGLDAITYSDFSLQSFQELLAKGDDSWFKLYRSRDLPKGLRRWQLAMDHTLASLHTQLISPLTAQFELKGISKLKIVPHRGLHLIPFSALFKTDQSGQKRYLIDDYEITYAPSSTIQQICREREACRPSHLTLTAMANPTGDLPFAAAEVDLVSACFPASQKTVLVESKARREVINSTTPISVFHFAGHGKYEWDEPLESHLLFAGNEALKLADLFTEKSQFPVASIVVLSACETSLSRPEDLADEYLSLASGFLFSGTPAVICTLWEVNDIATALLMIRFYESYTAGSANQADALRKAQIWLRDVTNEELAELFGKYRAFGSDTAMGRVAQEQFRDFVTRPGDASPFAHPYYWAPFVLYGS